MTQPHILEIICMQQVESMRLLHERIRGLELNLREGNELYMRLYDQLNESTNCSLATGQKYHWHHKFIDEMLAGIKSPEWDAKYKEMQEKLHNCESGWYAHSAQSYYRRGDEWRERMDALNKIDARDRKKIDELRS